MHSVQEQSTLRQHGQWWKRALLVLLACGAFFWTVGRWVTYRFDHLVTHDAVLRGVISRVGPRIEGRVAEVLVEADQRVQRGDVLARLEDQWQLAQLQQATAELERSVQTLSNERRMLDIDGQSLQLARASADALLSAADASVSASESAVHRWTNEVERITSVRRPGVISRSEWDEIHLKKETAQANLRAAKAQREAAESQSKSARVALEGLAVRIARLTVLEEDIEVAKARVASAKADVESTYIRAPADGWVSHRIAEAGASVRVGYPIVALWTDERVWVEAWVDESELDQVELGRAVDVRFAAYPTHVVVGHVKAIGVVSESELQSTSARRDLPLTNDSSRVAVTIALPDNPGIRLMPGLSAMVGIGTERSTSTFAGWGIDFK